MQSRGVNPRGNLEPVIELESGSNDPVAVFLTLGFTQMLTTPGASLVDLVPMFVIQMAVGGACGYLMGLGMTALINRLRLRQEGLYSVLTLALVLLVYGLATLIGGNGFLAVYLAGIVMGNRSFVHKRSLIRFHETGQRWLKPPSGMTNRLKPVCHTRSAFQCRAVVGPDNSSLPYTCEQR
jgi:potassium/hydrogen antiporter